MSWSLSLLDSQGGKPIDNAMAWITQALFGQMAISLCVIAIAFLGILMLGGRLPVRQGARVILGCFVLLGAPVIASGLMASTSGNDEVLKTLGPAELDPRAREDLPPATFDPYAGASLRREDR